ncbi:hypothetical protein JVU11DRAFT_298 [Chiua virens]|nr:hypothetical protein JVU11DRAFT_298 [Chiua virens]
MVHVCQWYIIPFLLVTTVLADYNIDNANTSVVYSISPSLTGWQTFSVNGVTEALNITNSTGSYIIPLDPSHCYDGNYAQGVCGTNDNCFVQIPFTGSGVTMYVYNAGGSGMTASFSVDGGTAVSQTIQQPPGPSFQQSNVSMYDIQGLTSGSHTMVMTVLDWNGADTSMKFDYAYVNETFVVVPATTSSTSSQTSTSSASQTSQKTSQSSTGIQTTTGTPSASSNKINLGGVIGGTLGGTVLLAGILIGFCCLRKKRKTAIPQQDAFSPESNFHVDPFTANSPVPPQTFAHYATTRHSQNLSGDVSSSTRSAILRDILTVRNHAPFSEPTQSIGSHSIRSGVSSPTPPVIQPLRGGMVSGGADGTDLERSNSPFSDAPMPSRINLTTEQLDIIDRLRSDKVPAETIARVIEGFMSPYQTDGTLTDGDRIRTLRSVSRTSFDTSVLPPPSYQTRDR